MTVKELIKALQKLGVGAKNYKVHIVYDGNVFDTDCLIPGLVGECVDILVLDQEVDDEN